MLHNSSLAEAGSVGRVIAGEGRRCTDMASAVAGNYASAVTLRAEDREVARSLIGHKVIGRDEGHSCSLNGSRRHEGTFPSRHLRQGILSVGLCPY